MQLATQNPLVLVAYAESCKYSDSLLASVRTRLESVLTSARTALQKARDNELAALQTAYDRAYNAAQKIFERESRIAGNHHGHSITRALTDLAARQATIISSHAAELEPLRAQYLESLAQTNVLSDTAYADALSPEHSPAHDIFKLAELAIDQQRELKLAESHTEYVREKDRCDAELSERMAVLEGDKKAALDAAKLELESSTTTLIAPLERNLLTAQAQFDDEMLSATTRHNRAREVRLNILENLSRCVIDEDHAIEKLRQ